MGRRAARAVWHAAWCTAAGAWRAIRGAGSIVAGAFRARPPISAELGGVQGLSSVEHAYVRTRFWAGHQRKRLQTARLDARQWWRRGGGYRTQRAVRVMQRLLLLVGVIVLLWLFLRSERIVRPSDNVVSAEAHVAIGENDRVVFSHSRDAMAQTYARTSCRRISNAELAAGLVDSGRYVLQDLLRLLERAVTANEDTRCSTAKEWRDINAQGLNLCIMTVLDEDTEQIVHFINPQPPQLDWRETAVTEEQCVLFPIDGAWSGVKRPTRVRFAATDVHGTAMSHVFERGEASRCAQASYDLLQGTV